MGVFSVKCRKCRHLLFTHPDVTVLTAHGDSCSNFSIKYVECKTIQEDNVWFLQDSSLPDWISILINEANWTKGKVNCPKCQGRLGSFDFVSGIRCYCGLNVLPPVHIVKCKVDCSTVRTIP